MAEKATSTDNLPWASALDNHRIAEDLWSAVELEENCPARERVAQILTDARGLLFSTSGPTIAAVIEKLTTWWGEALWDESYESQNRIVIGDLRRIALQSQGVEEPDVSGRSPEVIADLAEKWQAALAELSELMSLLVQGREDATWDAITYAEGVLLELPAPNLAGVVRKLELLWETDRFDSIEAGVFYVQLILDLSRLSRHPADELFDEQ